MLKHVAVCCSVLQCVAACCSVLQCVAACCIVLQCVTPRDTTSFVSLCIELTYCRCELQYAAVCCRVQCVAVWLQCSCSVLQCVAVCCSVLQCVAVCCSAVAVQVEAVVNLLAIVGTCLYINLLAIVSLYLYKDTMASLYDGEEIYIETRTNDGVVRVPSVYIKTDGYVSLYKDSYQHTYRHTQTHTQKHMQIVCMNGVGHSYIYECCVLQYTAVCCRVHCVTVWLQCSCSVL